MNTKRTIRNCLPVFQVVCPKLWDELTDSDDPSARHCNQCDRQVFLCTTDDETIAHARAGDCIAREMPDISGMRSIFLGKPVRPEAAIPETPEQREVGRMRQREWGVDDSIKNAERSARTCSKCHYPAPDWRLTCRVCGFEMGRANVDLSTR